MGINNSSSVSWLQDYVKQSGISYPFIFDSDSSLFSAYQVGFGFGNLPPTYIIIDQQGIVQYRIDNQYNRFQEMKDKIDELLS
jgi:peroxiredoxin